MRDDRTSFVAMLLDVEGGLVLRVLHDCDTDTGTTEPYPLQYQYEYMALVR